MKHVPSTPPSAPRSLKTRPLVIRLAEEEIGKAETYAANESRSRASFLRLMILRGLQDYEREHAAGN